MFNISHKIEISGKGLAEKKYPSNSFKGARKFRGIAAGDGYGCDGTIRLVAEIKS